MIVKRISSTALHKLINGKTAGPQTCIIKFYSSSCPLYHNLQEYFENIASEYEDIHFFAFNIADEPNIEKRLKFTGVPSICMVKTRPPKYQINIIEDPENPHKKTWFRVSDIKTFIERNK